MEQLGLPFISDFIVGSNNQFAYNIAKEFVYENKYNCIYFYGDVGMGKTTIVNGITAEIDSYVRAMNIEAFTNSLIDAVRDGKIKQFRNDFMACDVVVFDEMESIARKIHTQREFHQIVSSLLSEGNRIVMAGTKPPDEILINDIKLTDLFNIDAVCELTEPDFEIKRLIIEQQAEKSEIVLSAAAVEKLAHEKGSIQELLNKTIRLVSLKKHIPQENDIDLLMNEIIEDNREAVEALARSE
ncbi:MAG: dnaA [Firmicutes bacterium]|nr:dnaA [Bacillota bacterium]